MPMVLVLLALLLVPACLQAEDTPSNMGLVGSLLAGPRVAIAAKDWPRAIRELQAAIDTDPGNADAHNLLGYSYRKQAQPDLTRAFFHYHEALRLNPFHLAAREYLGEAYLQAGQPDRARAELKELERLCGRSCDEYRNLADAIEGIRREPKDW